MNCTLANILASPWKMFGNMTCLFEKIFFIAHFFRDAVIVVRGVNPFIQAFSSLTHYIRLRFSTQKTNRHQYNEKRHFFVNSLPANDVVQDLTYHYEPVIALVTQILNKLLHLLPGLFIVSYYPTNIHCQKVDITSHLICIL